MIEHFEMVAKAVSDTNRARILKLLKPGEFCVCQITAILELAPATVSKHLSILKMAGLVRQRKQGRWVYYRLADRSLNPYSLPFLALIDKSLNDDPTIVKDGELLRKINRIPVETLCSEGLAAIDTLVTEALAEG